LVDASRGLDMRGSEVALAASVQTLAIAASVISTGILADKLGRRFVLMVALAVGAAGNVLIALAPSSTVYMLGQIITGIGLGAVYSAAFAYIRMVAKPGQLPAAVGVFSAVVSLATLIFTFVGGSLSSVNWRLAFVILPIVSVLCMLAVPKLLPIQAKVDSGKQDIIGQVLLALGIIAFLYGVSELGHSLTSPRTLGPIIIGAVLLAAFFIFESKTPNHLYPVSLFKSPVFIGAILAGFIYTFGTAVAFLQVTNLWQYVLNLKTLEVSLWQLPLIGAGIISALMFGKLMAKGMGNHTALLIGTLTSVVGFVLLALNHDAKDLIGFLPGLILGGAGIVICAIPFGNLFIREAPPEYFGPVTSSRTTVGQFFFSIGFALSTVVIDKLTLGGTVDRLERAGVPPNQTGTALDAVTAYAARSTAPTTSLGHQALADATSSYASAFASAMYIAAGLMLITGLIGYLLLARNTREAT